MIEVPNTAIELVKKFEGLHKVKNDLIYPYVCPAGFWTIGYGHLCQSTTQPITEEQADLYLAQDLAIAMRATLKHCPVLINESENKLSAMIDFTFNLGSGRLQCSTLRRKINQKDWIGASKELNKWIYGGGKILKGLVKRRAEESFLILH